MDKEKILELKEMMWYLNYIFTDPIDRCNMKDTNLKPKFKKFYYDIKENFNLDMPIFKDLTFNNIDERKTQIKESLSELQKIDVLSNFRNVDMELDKLGRSLTLENDLFE